MSKKYNWAIVSGNIRDAKIDYVNIINDKTKTELGAYIKSHIDDLIDHLQCMTDGITTLLKNGEKIKDNKIYSILKHFIQTFEDLETCQDYKKLLKQLSKKFDKLSDETVVKNFYYKSEYSFTTISHLEKNLKEEILEPNSSDEFDESI